AYSSALSHDGGAIRPYTGPDFAMKGGERYTFECWIRADKPNSSIYVELRNQDGELAVGSGGKIVSGGAGSIGSYLMSNYTVPTTWTHYQITFDAKPNTKMVYFQGFYFNHSNGTERNAKVWIAGMSIRPMVGAVLIEDGAVSADKLTADSIDTRHLRSEAITSDKIGANQIIAGKIAANAVDTAQLRANAVDADKIAANARS